MWYESRIWGRVHDAHTGTQQVVNGEIFKPTFSEWTGIPELKPANYRGTPNIFILSGSIFETELPPAHESRWLALGVIAPVEANIHLNLEDVFGADLANDLRDAFIFTLEDVAAERAAEPLGFFSFTGNIERVPLRQFLKVKAQATDEQVDDWIELAKMAIEKPAAPLTKDDDGE
jgi:hypothetical protein